MKIIKRNGSEVAFDAEKIVAAVWAAMKETGEDGYAEARQVAYKVDAKAFRRSGTLTVEDIQDLVETTLMDEGYYETARAYIRYRYDRMLKRQKNSTDERILSLLNCNNEEAKQENSNKNPVIASVQRDYMAGEVSKDIAQRYLIPERIWHAHEEGVIHFHDADYFSQPIFNCCLVNLEDMLQNGTVISRTMIEKPHSFATACNIATQIIAQVASCQYGGQTITLSHLSPFVDVSRQRIRFEVSEELYGYDCYPINSPENPQGDVERVIDQVTEERLRAEVARGVQTIQYQILTLMTTNGQTPFVSINMYLGEVPEGRQRDDLAMVIEEVLKQRIQGVKNEDGVWITPAFPKLLYVLEPENMEPGSKYNYLTWLAAKCTARRMVPDYISEKQMKMLKIDQNGDGQCYPCMGCRSFLTPYVTEEGKPKYYGRFNQGVVTINLVDVACSAEGDEERFWQIFEERLNLCHEALRVRHEHLLGTKSDTSPIHWQYGAIARLPKGAVIDPLLYNGYSTISLGYAGLSECVWRMKGESHTQPVGKEFGLRVMQYMVDKTQEWKAQENIDYSLYGTPIESTTYKFAKCLQRRFGKIPHVTDKGYITNSYHVHVTEPIDAFTKLSLESEFQKLSPGGAISYVEVPDMRNNPEAVMAVIRHIYEHIIYAELNTKSDYCQACGYEGEIEIVEQDGKLIWRCPKCGNTDQSKMNVARRTCGYIGTNFWNQGRTEEIKERVLHL